MSVHRSSVTFTFVYQGFASGVQAAHISSVHAWRSGDTITCLSREQIQK